MRYMFIVNPIAGGGKAASLVKQIITRFENAPVEFDLYTTRERGDATGAARKAAAQGCDAVIAVGGDGTVNEVLNGIVGSQAVLGAVPGGKGNDFASSVGMPRDVDAACDALLNFNVKQIDLGKVLDRYFINSVGVGFDAAVAHRVNQGVRPFKGVSAYIYAVIATLANYRPVEMEITLDDATFTLTPILVAVGIGQCYGGGMRIVPDAIQDDGLFDTCIFDKMGKLALLYHFPKVFKGRHTRLKQAIMGRSSEVKLALGEVRPLHMEGEVLFGDRMHFTLEPGGMKVLTGTP